MSIPILPRAPIWIILDNGIGSPLQHTMGAKQDEWIRAKSYFPRPSFSSHGIIVHRSIEKSFIFQYRTLSIRGVFGAHAKLCTNLSQRSTPAGQLGGNQSARRGSSEMLNTVQERQVYGLNLLVLLPYKVLLIHRGPGQQTVRKRTQ